MDADDFSQTDSGAEQTPSSLACAIILEDEADEYEGLDEVHAGIPQVVAFPNSAECEREERALDDLPAKMRFAGILGGAGEDGEEEGS